ncbi:hypothetical protein PHAVU_009G224000 [Phaseolus vulgaris]|uniref:Uncharacterized protein n=1 Tax=Phaseolus vulgaris TaxID=3885 RepID=V7AYF5_PHAVU|nr:hypothetical protein PHAVU_009G224000g [Phaseolus vulgaris]XP_007138621.1 hypothetical protein PHAVU_009G224000g [Phaseolus vulgaris]ESW10614.1 hypothetical protein PHAVU_009G224000g [Phaseolus vulgaris]ESW10615.1 hypothetical protein PHAVU_009G224000g [Phaseolus vulgaris]
MDSGVGCKVTGIRQIVRLKEMLQKWQNVTLGPKPSIPTISDQVPNDGTLKPLINKRVVNVMNCESDTEESCQSPEPLPPPDVPKGYLAVYVGPELRRFIIPTTYLSHSLFKVLLEKAADEFGFDHSGGLTIPCEIETFKYLLKCIENEQKDQLNDPTQSESSGSVEE